MTPEEINLKMAVLKRDFAKRQWERELEIENKMPGAIRVQLAELEFQSNPYIGNVCKIEPSY